ncbi:spermidine/putrescine transport system ATP-binding protein [Actinoalloteichus hoggarensis]|uniref:Spermidine/putrescine import ATP-binding protein PotA n=1 Tax=Actinoalloteichus hoggarensis TaxID=1470176 RepID=A0A221W0P1_9PSEU|nr:ABC transporter ATP-binding protein [Actinoalloteichus hoggarensis]ASO19337.1 Spermidine/putrescine import ATP-binding protein PotA [Actinoalloteichus hoggarensis]MBB5920574.1 spermidine/putrescine transport system ATP-binding protein [Actinoalloteichus hoggarensis]
MTDESAEFHPREQRTPDTYAPVAVALSGVTRSYGDQVVLDDLSLRVHEGEFFSILGPSGSGKTTLLRMIAGFADPERGSIELDGVDMVGVPPYRRDVNTVFQSYALFPHLDVWNNVAYALRRKGLRGGELRRRVGEHLELVQLSGFARRRPHQLSGGQQQRVAVARALAARPRVLLLDEPLGALDAQLRGRMQVELMRIQREVGTTFLYITHDQEEALVLSHRLAVLAGGRIRQVGYPEDVYERPATRFVASFLRSSATGTTNILDSEVVGHDAAANLLELAVGAGARLRAALPAEATARPGSRVTLTVRPEKVHVYDVDGAVAPPAGWCLLPGTVVDIVYTGVSTQYLVQVPAAGGSTLVAFVQNTRRISDAGGPGQPVLLAWEPEHSVLLAEDADLDGHGPAQAGS